VAKKFLLALVLLVLATGVVFSQTDFKGMAKNTITVDFGPTIYGAAIIGAADDIAKNMLEGDLSLNSSGFGIAAQYERQLLKNFSVAGRFSYLGGGVGVSQSNTETISGGGTAILTTDLGVKIISYSVEAHARYYPWGKTFFLDGMLGYANMTVDFSGKIVGTVDAYKEEFSVNMNASQGFLTVGAKLGWRISFGKNGGFTFEPSLGYVYGIGFGDTVGDRLSKQINDKSEGAVDIKDNNFGQIFDILQNYVFIGGPRLSLAFGWRF